MTYFFLERLIFFWLTLLDIFCLEFMLIQTPEETNHEIKTKRHTFSLVSDTDVEKLFVFSVSPCLFNKYSFIAW